MNRFKERATVVIVAAIVALVITFGATCALILLSLLLHE